jgi:hypothetical protein
MSVRKRTWKTAGGEERQAWLCDYNGQSGKRHVKTFARKKDSEGSPLISPIPKRGIFLARGHGSRNGERRGDAIPSWGEIKNRCLLLSMNAFAG